MERRQAEMSSESTRIAQEIDRVSRHVKGYRSTYGSGWGGASQGGCFAARQLDKPNQEQQAAIVKLAKAVDLYNSDYVILREYARSLHAVIDTACQSQPRTRQEVEIQSILQLVNKRVEAWDGCVDRHESFEGLCGACLSRINCRTLERFKPLLKLAYPAKRITGIGRVSQKLGEQHVASRRGYTVPWSQPQDVLASKTTSRGHRPLWSLKPEHQQQLVRRFPQAVRSIIGCNGLDLADVKQLRKTNNRCAAYARLCRQFASTHQTSKIGTESWIVDRPELVGSVNIDNVSVELFRVRCLAGDDLTDSYAWFLGRPASEVVQEIASQVTWYHTHNHPCKDDSITGDVLSHVQEVMRGRVHQAIERREYQARYNASIEDRKRMQRREIAKYARKLRVAGELSMLDSKAAHNCLPGTLEFCERIGVHLPSRNWTDTRIDARHLLRLWKNADWVADSLFLKAINCCELRTNRERMDLAPCA